VTDLVRAADPAYWHNVPTGRRSVRTSTRTLNQTPFADRTSYVQVHPLVYLTKLNIEMNMAELLGKVVKTSTQSRNNEPPSTDIWRPHLGIRDFDREWLGSAKDLIMPSAGRGAGGGGGDGGVQMVDLNMDILNEPSSNGKERASSSGAQGDMERHGVDDVERKDSGTSGVNV
jgi:trafficking protein particle complex subunit 12